MDFAGVSGVSGSCSGGRNEVGTLSNGLTWLSELAASFHMLSLGFESVDEIECTNLARE